MPGFRFDTPAHIVAQRNVQEVDLSSNLQHPIDGLKDIHFHWFLERGGAADLFLGEGVVRAACLCGGDGRWQPSDLGDAVSVKSGTVRSLESDCGHTRPRFGGAGRISTVGGRGGFHHDRSAGMLGIKIMTFGAHKHNKLTQ